MKNVNELTPDQRALGDAIEQLNQSERGRAAAVAFRRFLEANEGSASSLDSNNLRALETLARSCRIFGPWNVRELLPKK
jgi:regulator of protease activity HflC (stomatin/prohibitin superfamily)